MKRYLVLALRGPAFDPAAIAPHGAFLDRLRRDGRLELAGPFADRTGGAYLLRAESVEAAHAIAMTDPLHATGSSEIVVHEWDAR